MPMSNRKRSPLKRPLKDPSFPTLSPDLSQLLRTEQSLMIKRAVRSADKHGIQLSPGRRNPGSGNCAFESAIFNVNDRQCFKEKFPLSVDHYRRVWVTDMKNRTMNQRLARLGLQSRDRDRDLLSLSLNFETETETFFL